jgi:hypothetical protein
MKQAVISVALFWLVLTASAPAADAPKPFGFAPGHSPYEDVVARLQQNDWRWSEYEKKQMKTVGRSDPERGINTFMLVEPEGLEGVQRLLLFFSGKSVLDAVIIVIDPSLFESVMDELDHKYKVVERKLEGRSFSTDYPRVLYQQGPLYIELQRLTAHHVRLVYVEKVLYENYKEFLYKTYEPFRRRLVKKNWMKEL